MNERFIEETEEEEERSFSRLASKIVLRSPMLSVFPLTASFSLSFGE